MSSPIIATASDSGFFRLAKGLILSIRDKPAGRRMPIGLLDLGLDDGQREWLAARDVVVVKPGWDIDFPGRAAKPETYKAQVARPFLPRHFPGHDVILWLDADCWLQTWDAIPWFTGLARGGGIAIVPELDRAFRVMRHPENLKGMRQIFASAFGADATDLGFRPVLNVGAFAMRADDPFWTRWQETLAGLLQRTDTFYAEQLAFNYLAYNGQPNIGLLPALYNWTCHQAIPRFQHATGDLVETAPPYRALSIVHLTHKEKGKGMHRLRAIGGPEVEISLLYRGGDY